MRFNVTVSPFQPEDWGKAVAMEGLTMFEPPAEALRHLAVNGLGFTLKDEAGRVVACMGGRWLGQKRVEVWIILDYRCTSRERVTIAAAARAQLDACAADRAEAFVECDFTEGHTWLKHLGFQLEAPRMRRYLPDGKDCALYARVRGVDGQWGSPS